mmetsp:Transcript_13464/g.40081  ORF Transcript_13464/g.40081 Transcript_13464/m.40081 type:complete len:273 (+) Transcript_13464:384-1202(+)
MPGAMLMPSHPKATQTAATTAAPDEPNARSRCRDAGVKDTATTATASRALSTPTASGPSPKRFCTKRAASTRGVSMAVTKSEYARRSESTERASERKDTRPLAPCSESERLAAGRGDRDRRSRRCARACRCASVASEKAAAASTAAASSQRRAMAHARPTSSLSARTSVAATTRATAHDVVNRPNKRVRCMCVAAMSVARAVSRPPFAAQPVSRRHASTPEKVVALPQKKSAKAVKKSVATSTGRRPKRSERSPTYGLEMALANGYADTSMA